MKDFNLDFIEHNHPQKNKQETPTFQRNGRATNEANS